MGLLQDAFMPMMEINSSSTLTRISTYKQSIYIAEVRPIKLRMQQRIHGCKGKVLGLSRALCTHMVIGRRESINVLDDSHVAILDLVDFSSPPEDNVATFHKDDLRSTIDGRTSRKG